MPIQPMRILRVSGQSIGHDDNGSAMPFQYVDQSLWQRLPQLQSMPSPALRMRMIGFIESIQAHSAQKDACYMLFGGKILDCVPLAPPSSPLKIASFGDLEVLVVFESFKGWFERAQRRCRGLTAKGKIAIVDWGLNRNWELGETPLLRGVDLEDFLTCLRELATDMGLILEYADGADYKSHLSATMKIMLRRETNIESRVLQPRAAVENLL